MLWKPSFITFNCFVFTVCYRRVPLKKSTSSQEATPAWIHSRDGHERSRNDTGVPSVTYFFFFYSQTAMELLWSIPEVKRKRRHARAHGASFPGPFAGHQWPVGCVDGQTQNGQKKPQSTAVLYMYFKVFINHLLTTVTVNTASE